MDRFFVYSIGNYADVAHPLSARSADREYFDTDAGVFDGEVGTTFVVRAPSQEAALQGARDWVAFWADEDQDMVPDGLGLEERVPDKRFARSYMILRVEA